jgi:hypothetical protein
VLALSWYGQTIARCVNVVGNSPTKTSGYRAAPGGKMIKDLGYIGMIDMVFMGRQRILLCRLFNRHLNVVRRKQDGQAVCFWCYHLVSEGRRRGKLAEVGEQPTTAQGVSTVEGNMQS